MRTRILALKERILLVLLVLGLIAAVLLIRPASVRQVEAVSGDQAPTALTRYYNLIGYEGIGTLGATGFTSGSTPPVGDYVTTHCRYIDVPNTTLGHYYLRYPLHLPDGVTITKVSLFVADYNPTGVMWAYLRSRPWASRDAGTSLDWTLTDNISDYDKLIDMGTTSVTVNNETTEYWIDVSPQNSADPGQLCVYGIQVTYTYNGAFLPLVQRNS